MAENLCAVRWSSEEISCLIGIWGDYIIQNQFDGTVRDSEVYRKICETLLKCGFTRNVAQIRTKIKALKREYRLQKDKLQTSGAAGKINFKYFHQLDQILENRDATEPSKILETSILGLEETGQVCGISEEEVDVSCVKIEMEESNASTLPPPSPGKTAPGTLPNPSPSGTAAGTPPNPSPGSTSTANLAPPSPAATSPSPSMQSGPSSTRRKKKKSLKDIIVESMQQQVEKFISFEREVEQNNIRLQEKRLEIEREKLLIEREKIEVLKLLLNQ